MRTVFNYFAFFTIPIWVLPMLVIVATTDRARFILTVELKTLDCKVTFK